MKQLSEMYGLCKYCVGDCMRLELENFEGIYRCNGFEPRKKNWYSEYKEDLRREQEGNLK